MDNLPFVSIVVIGLNEELHLKDTFNAVMKIDYPVDKYELIYVDSGSSDKSVEIADKFTNKVFIERSVYPTAARGRNRGLVEATGEIVHFIDGDVQIDKEYIRKVVNIMRKKDVCAVYGYLIEKSSDGLNRILLSHWERRESGYSHAAGAGGTFDKKVLLSVGGYDERIRRGEETELGERLNLNNHKIWYIDECMGIHDYGIKGWGDLYKTYYSDGYHKSFIMRIRGNSAFLKSTRRSYYNNFTFCFGIFSLTLITMILIGFWGVFASVTLFAFYFLSKSVIKRRIKSKETFLYYFFMEISRFVSLFGQLSGEIEFLRNRDKFDRVFCSKMVINAK